MLCCSRQAEGNGCERFASGDVYEGDYRNGKMQGCAATATRADTLAAVRHAATRSARAASSAAAAPRRYGTYRFVDGEADVVAFSNGEPVGTAVRWNPDRTRAFRIDDGGDDEDEIGLEEARQLAARIRKWPIGLPIPEAPGPNPPPPLKRPAGPKR